MDRYEFSNRDMAKMAFQRRKTIEQNLSENEISQTKLIHRNDVNLQKALNCINVLANEYANGTSESEIPSGMTPEKFRQLVNIIQPWSNHVDDKLANLKQGASNLRQEKYTLYRKKEFENHRYGI